MQAYAHATGDGEAMEVAQQALWRGFEQFDDQERSV